MSRAGAGAVRVDLPARLNLLGNPSDANEGDFAVISLAVELRAEVALRAARSRRARVDGGWHVLPDALPAPAEGPARLVVAALDSLVHHSEAARAALAGRGFELELATAIPRGSGMGGSSALGLGCLAALTRWLDLDPRTHHLYRLAEWAQFGEERYAGVVGGYIDFYAPLFGGLSYVDFRGKLEHGPEGAAPFATVERLDALAPPLPLVVAWSGVEHASGEVHAPMRARYLAERARGAGELLGIMREVGDCAWLGKQALLRGDLGEVGRLLDRNHALVDRMMRSCGFADGAGAGNNALIAAARAAGALGAKLTGAGAGGSILALAEPGAEAALDARLRAALPGLGLSRAQVFRPQPASEGIRVRTE
jgi:galactokinase/mevalonate kinase-like predicted kinase